MSGSKRHVLDANVFIEAKNRYYGFGLCPGFWKALVAENKSEHVFSIDKVREELVGGGDDLSTWAKDTVPKSFFKKTQDQAVVGAFQAMVAWVNSDPQFMPAAKEEFANGADGWIIAYAEVNKLIVVTHEVLGPDAKKTVPMPNVCVKFKVDYVNTFEMLDDLKVKFVLGPKRR